MKKRTLIICGFILVLVALAAVSYFGILGNEQNDISPKQPATLTYVYADKNIKQTLTEDETYTLAEIFNGRREYRNTVPSCGFDADVSVTIDGVKFAPACDLCSSFMNVNRLSYFDISEEEMDIVRGIFEKYGGTFPCI